MPFTTSSIPDLSGSVAVVTGANGGLGLEIARGFASAGAHVVLATRDQAKTTAAAVAIRATAADASLQVVELDLASLVSTEQAASQIKASHDQVDILINNAGVMALPEGRTVDGFERQMGINHLGHWAFTSHLLPLLLAAPQARIVAQTSAARLFTTRINYANPHLTDCYRPWVAYYQSKLANYLFALGLQQRFNFAGVKARSLAAHPGLSDSDLQATTHSHGGAGLLGALAHKAADVSGMTPLRGALPAVRAAVDPGASGGSLYAPRFVSFGSPVRRPIQRPGWRTAAKRLWSMSEAETGLAIEIESNL